ncbi:MAG: hypothetical protein IPO78_10155 [Saprospiraceae bacterium]|nr:hypothetical protein [Saprospiraceae bacterium]
MAKLYKSQVKLCAKDNCITLYGDSAKFFNGIVAVACVLMFLSIIKEAQ